MRKGKTRALAIVLAIGMIFTLMPNVSVRAEDMGQPEAVVEAQAASEGGVETPVVEEQPEVVVPEATAPAAVVPEVTEPETVVPEAAEAEAVVQKAAEVKATAPEKAEVKAAEPEVTAAEETEQKNTENEIAPCGVTDVTGGSTSNTYKHTYHTKIDATANVTVKDAAGNVVETAQRNMQGEFVEGNLSDSAVQAELTRIQNEIEEEFISRGTITRENVKGKLVFDHFESSNILDFDNDHVNKNLDVHEYQVYQTTYDLIVQENNEDEATVINHVEVVGAKLSYMAGETPVATATVTGEDATKCNVEYECWEEIENGVRVGVWYSNESQYTADMKKFSQFESGKTYRYSIALNEKEGYKFPLDNCSIIVNGISVAEDNIIPTYNGVFAGSVQTFRPVSDTVAEKEIPVVEINNATLDFKHGDKPVFTGTIPENAKYYRLHFEEWRNGNEWTRSDEWYNNAEHHGSDKEITAFDKDKLYDYNLYLTTSAEAGNEWYFGPGTKLKINGREYAYTRGESGNDQNFTVSLEGFLHPEPEQWQAIDVVEINDATITCKNGDKPVFTGKTPENAPYIYQFECWETEDGAGVNSAEFFDQAYENHITAFESGKTYKYITYMKAEYGYYFTDDTKLKINGKFYGYKNIDKEIWGDEERIPTWWAYTDLTMTPADEAEENQEITLIDVGNIWKSLDCTRPIAYAGEVNPNSECAEQMELVQECWSSEGHSFSSLDAYEGYPNKGFHYGYSVKLQAKDGFVFSDKFAGGNSSGSVRFICDGNVVERYSANIADDGKTITLSDFISVKPTEGAVEETVIKDVKIVDATFSYKAGDAPVATAKITDENASDYEILYEEWEEMETTGEGFLEPVAFWFSNESQYNSGMTRITKFEEGKRYMYSIGLKAKNGCTFAKTDAGLTMKVNGNDVKASNIDNTGDGTVLIAVAVKTINVEKAVEPVTPEKPNPENPSPETPGNPYKFLEGENSSWTQNSEGTLTFRANGDFSKFTSVKVDGVLVDPKNYTAVSGSTIVTFMKEYLATLSNGIHKLTVVYTDGECSTNFTVKEAAKPQKQDAGKKQDDGRKQDAGKKQDDGKKQDAGKKQDDSKADTTQANNNTSVPKTGDRTEQGRLIMLVGVTAIIMAADMIYRRKRNK